MSHRVYVYICIYLCVHLYVHVCMCIHKLPSILLFGLFSFVTRDEDFIQRCMRYSLCFSITKYF